MYRWIALVVALLAFTACNGSSGPKIPPPINGLEAILRALAEEAGGKATLRATVDLEGLTPVAPVGAPTGATIMGKIINPGDDILNETPITPGTQFEIKLDESVRGQLQIELQVEEDINGDGEGPDPIVASLPVDLAAGRVSTLNLTLSRAVQQQGAPGPDGPPVVEEVFFPAEGAVGEVLVLELVLSDAGGSKSQIYALAGTSVIFDADGDRFIEAGDDTVYDDGNRNGWPDISETVFHAEEATAANLTGTVSGLDRATRTLTIRDSAGVETDVVVDPFASIVPVTVDGVPLSGLLLDQSLVGREVQVYGWTVLGETYATLVVVLPVRATPQ